MTRGRKKGQLTVGSLPWHLSRLEVGESLLIDDKGTPAGYSRLSALHLTSRRAAEITGHTYQVRTCTGAELEIGSPTFRFYKISRES